MFCKCPLVYWDAGETGAIAAEGVGIEAASGACAGTGAGSEGTMGVFAGALMAVGAVTGAIGAASAGPA